MLLSSWLGSFEAYGFRYVILAAVEENELIGGIGLVIAKFGPFKFVNCPMGPLIKKGREAEIKFLVSEAVNYCKTIKCNAFQMEAPFSTDRTTEFLLPETELKIDAHSERGFPFRFAYAPNQLLWIDFNRFTGADNEEKLLKSFNSNTRRNIRASMKSGLELRYARTPEEIKEAYNLIELNGIQHGYAVRKWEDFGEWLISQVNDGFAMILTANYNDIPVSAHYSILAGRRCTYVMGGTMRMEKDLKAGHFIHWQAILYAMRNGFLGYDFSSGGSPGVMRFKHGFNPEHIQFADPYVFIFSPGKYLLFRKIWPLVQKNKETVSSILKLFRRIS